MRGTQRAGPVRSATRLALRISWQVRVAPLAFASGTAKAKGKSLLTVWFPETLKHPVRDSGRFQPFRNGMYLSVG
jgi:hypothetical protein